MEKLKNWLKGKPTWLKIIILAAILTATIWSNVACTTTHTVQHTFINPATGDTIIQRYEQKAKTSTIFDRENKDKEQTKENN